MKCVASGFADDSDDAAVVVAVLGIEVVGEDAEFFDRIEVGNDGGATVHVLLHVDSIDHEAVGGFALAVDGEVAGVSVAGGIDTAGDAGHDDGARQKGGDGSDAGLDREQIGVAAAVQRKRRHLRGGDDLAEMGRRGFDLCAGVAVTVTVSSVQADLEGDIHADCGVGIDRRGPSFAAAVNPVAVMVRS